MDELRCDGGLDVECASWDRFAVGATYSSASQEAIVHHSGSDLVDYLLSVGGHWWAHNGGRYDFLLVAEELRRRQVKCSIDLSMGAVSRIACGKLVLRDSYALIPLPLRVAADVAGEKVSEVGLRCVCGGNCGGYCSIRPGDRRPSVADKCAHDAMVTCRVVTVLQERARGLGMTVKGTVAGTAWATARDTLMLPDSELTSAEDRYLRSAYHGGRVTIVRPRATGPGAHHDISAAYPAALAKTSLPVGLPRALGARLARREFQSESPGVYTATVRVPEETFLPVLPTRVAGRLRFLTGTFRGTWTLPELIAAVERGTEIVDLHRAMTWSNSVPVFGELIHHWYDARRRVGKETAMGKWLRLVANSLTGSLAMSPERRAVRMFPDEIKYCGLRRPCTAGQCTGRCGAFQQIDLWGQIWGVPYYRLAPSGHVHWAAYLTSVTRLAWLAGAESQGDSLVYGDTDSIWTLSRSGPKPSGAGLGEWTYKHGWRDWECVGPRAYRYRDDTGRGRVTTAGMSISDEEWLSGHGRSTRGVKGFIEAARSGRGLFRMAERRWTLPKRCAETGIYGDRKVALRHDVTYPLTYGEAHSSSGTTERT